jgi:hypothetical protein
MPARRRETAGVALALAAGLLLAGLLVSGWRLVRTQSAIATAQADLEGCRDLARQIVNHRERPAFLSELPTSDSSVTTQINQAVQAAQIPPASVSTIDPQPLLTVGDAGLRRQTVIVDFTNLGLPQLVTFLAAVQEADPTWTNSHLGLSATANRETTTANGELWSVQVTLTRFSYSPITRDIP